MERAYNDENSGGGYTKEASKLEMETREQVKYIIRRELENGTPVEVLSYVLHDAIFVEILAQKTYLRLGKGVDGFNDYRH